MRLWKPDASLLIHYVARREELEASANELFNVVAAHNALEARATSDSTVLTI
jgi:hypothetical protein